MLTFSDKAQPFSRSNRTSGSLEAAFQAKQYSSMATFITWKADPASSSIAPDSVGVASTTSFAFPYGPRSALTPARFSSPLFILYSDTQSSSLKTNISSSLQETFCRARPPRSSSGHEQAVFSRAGPRLSPCRGNIQCFLGVTYLYHLRTLPGWLLDLQWPDIFTGQQNKNREKSRSS